MMADFASWKQENLAKYAEEVSEENKVLREDNRMLLAAWRKAVSEKYLAEALAGSQGPALPPQLPMPALAMAGVSQRLRGPSK
jgi:hypothetical protein